MYEVSEESYKKALKPFDVVTDKVGNVGFVKEVSVNNCQTSFEHQISYAVTWLVGTNSKVAWFDHSELKKHCNIMAKLAENSCHPFGHNARQVETLFSHM